MVGDDSTEATASVKYNRNKNILTGEVVIPNFDVQLGIRVAGVDSKVKQNNLRGISVEVTNKDILQLTLVGSMRYFYKPNMGSCASSKIFLLQ